MQNTKSFIKPFIALGVVFILAGFFALRTQAADQQEINSLQKQMKEILDGQKKILSELQEIKQDIHKVKIRIGPR